MYLSRVSRVYTRKGIGGELTNEHIDIINYRYVFLVGIEGEGLTLVAFNGLCFDRLFELLGEGVGGASSAGGRINNNVGECSINRDLNTKIAKRNAVGNAWGNEDGTRRRRSEDLGRVESTREQARWLRAGRESEWGEGTASGRVVAGEGKRSGGG